ncbi:MAG TPA: efflux RND transporter periplasmic adaptor subunit [Alphaproteobacteria bacterium]|nr:efflux RND transporter periplasmic adaptor subunit [Alphaproteobacteria bacterium]
MRMRAAFAGLALALAAAWPTTALGAEAEPSVLVKTIPLATHVIAETLSGYGQVQADPDSESSIVTAHDGIVDRLEVRLGERVAAGAPLLELETAPTAHTQFVQAEAALTLARNDLARTERLLKEQLATTDQVAAARNALTQAEANLEAQKRLGAGSDQETIRAPYDGIIAKLLVNPGDRVAANTTIALIARGSALLVPLGVEPEDAARVKPGMPVALSSPFTADPPLKGTVERVHAMIDPATRMVNAIVRVEPADSTQLVLGMAVSGTITLSRREILAVPRNAVLHDDKGDYLFVVRDGTAHRVNVAIQGETDGLVGIAGPLAAGDPVVVTGNYELDDGAKIRLQP